MKKILSLSLAIMMLVSVVPTAFAADTQNYSQGTQVVYTAENNESYFITVPARLNPGQSGTVTLNGSWPSNKTVTVTAEPTVTLTNSILASDQKVLDITFLGISKAGNDTAAKTYTETVSVEGIENALFGIWSGKFNYHVDFTSNPEADSPAQDETFVPIVVEYSASQEMQTYTAAIETPNVAKWEVRISEDTILNYDAVWDGTASLSITGNSQEGGIYLDSLTNTPDEYQGKTFVIDANMVSALSVSYVDTFSGSYLYIELYPLDSNGNYVEWTESDIRIMQQSP